MDGGFGSLHLKVCVAEVRQGPQCGSAKQTETVSGPVVLQGRLCILGHPPSSDWFFLPCLAGLVKLGV